MQNYQPSPIQWYQNCFFVCGNHKLHHSKAWWTKNIEVMRPRGMQSLSPTKLSMVIWR